MISKLLEPRVCAVVYGTYMLIITNYICSERKNHILFPNVISPDYTSSLWLHNLKYRLFLLTLTGKVVTSFFYNQFYVTYENKVDFFSSESNKLLITVKIKNANLSKNLLIFQFYLALKL